MREVKYLSPTSIGLWKKDRTEFYLTYLADKRPPRIPQSCPMAIGAAFDAYIKSYLYGALIGSTKGTDFEFERLFENQVEVQNRDWAKKHGAHVFASYRSSGALADLLLELSAARDVQFEFKVENRVAHSACIDGVPLLGKPDIQFYTKAGERVVHDWKVNGYCGKGTTSPKKGYINLYETDGNKKGAHKEVVKLTTNGLTINGTHYMEEINEDWATQLAIYSWILGAPVGSKFVCMIDQIVAKNSGNEFPILKTAIHRNRVSDNYQEALYAQLVIIWTRIQKGPEYIFDDLSHEESAARCAVLDAHYKDVTENDDWFEGATRSHKNY